MARLIVVDGPDLGSTFELTAPGGGAGAAPGPVIGRDPEADVPLNDGAVSREHCRIERTRRGYRLLDLGSRNRTYVNGDPIDDALLNDGDLVRVGDSDLRFESDEDVFAEEVASTIIKEIGLLDARDRQSRLLEGVQRRLEEAVEEPVDAAPPRGATAASRGLTAIMDLPRRLSEAESIAALLETFVRSVTELLGARQGVFLARQRGQWSLKARHPEGDVTGLSRSIIDRAAEARAPLLFELEGEGEARPSESIVSQGVRSALAVPIIDGRKLFGVVYLARDASSPESEAIFSSEDLALLENLSASVGPALRRLEVNERLVDDKRNLVRELSSERQIIARSEAMAEVLDFIDRAAPTPMTVLIEGETGTGKELVASGLHYASPRQGRPFVALNCAALPENLIESELFGHEKGAFTSAHTQKKGRFELADSGTVFLDEIGELSLPCQAKLLRLLEERCFERVGGSAPVVVDVRIIAATNKKLEEEVAAGRFREDLLYRLNVLGIRLPPLRERREDIEILVEHFLERAAEEGRGRRLSKTAARKLEKYDWPGNVRQLRNVIESATVLSRGDSIGPEDVKLPPVRLPDSPGTSPAGSTTKSGDWEPVSLQELEREHILRVLDHTGGNKKRAAEILGIERCTLYSKLKNYQSS